MGESRRGGGGGKGGREGGGVGVQKATATAAAHDNYEVHPPMFFVS